MDDFSRLEPTRHMLRWLADEPYAAIRSGVEGILRRQVPDCRIAEFRVTSEPQWLTGARPSAGDANKALLVRTGLAFQFEAAVGDAAPSADRVHGVFSWVGVHLDDPGRCQHRVWVDIDGSLDAFGAEGELQARMYFA